MKSKTNVQTYAMNHPEEAVGLFGLISIWNPDKRMDLLKRLEKLIDESPEESLEAGFYIRMHEIIEGMDDNFFLSILDFFKKHVFCTDEFLTQHLKGDCGPELHQEGRIVGYGTQEE